MDDYEWLARFQNNEEDAPPKSLLNVEIEVSEILLDKDNKPVRDPEYRITKVHEVRKPDPNTELFDGLNQATNTTEDGPENGES